MKLLLQHKIVAGYILLMAVIACMVAIVLHERKRVAEIEQESTGIFQTQNNINTAHRYITVLATFGESVMIWNDKDSETYNTRRLKADSLLQVLREQCKEFVHPEQVDSLRTLLLNKEAHLFRMRDIFRQQKHIDSLLANQYSLVTSQTSEPRTVTRKKKGIAGFFGGKETVLLPAVNSKNKSRNNELISLQEERQQDIEILTDSLRLQNRELSRKLRSLIISLDEQALLALQTKEARLKKSYEYSTFVITGLIVFSILLLIVSYWIIQRDIREKANHDKLMESTVKSLQENISENKRLIDARRRTIQTITHELRTPLASIMGNAELIESDKKSERLQHLSSIQLSAKRMSALLDSLMNFFQLDNGKVQADCKPFQLKSIADTLHQEFAPQAEARQLAFQVKNCSNEVVVGDKDLILRIGSNLLSNAVKFTEHGIVSLSVSYHDNVFAMMVEDTGSGISKEQQERIYRPFERLINAATQDGFGLGLPIVRELVELMNGKLSLESEPGKGCHFRVELPLEPAEESVLKTDKLQPSQKLHDIFVLVLDNDDMMLSMTRDMLTRRKINCDICRNVRELLDRMRSRNYDVLITDLKMPDMNGYEVMELLRTSNIGNSQEIPIIVSTAIDKNLENELLAAGFCSCLFKPFSSDEAANVIISCVGDKQQRQRIDLSALLEYGNKKETLERLIAETEKKLMELRTAYENRNITELDALVHHLRSSWMLIKADRPLQELYDLTHGDLSDEALLKERMQAVLDNGWHIIRLAKKRLEDLWEK